MLMKTKNYCDQARILVEGGIIRNGVQHPWMENTTYGASRVRVVNFSDGSSEEQQGHAGAYFSDARDLDAYLSASAKEPELTKQKLIMIEGLEPRILEVVGVTYGIPASFFLGHCDEWTEINIVNQAWAKQSSPVYWRVPIPQVRHIDTDTLEEKFGRDCYGTWKIVTGNAERWDLEIRPGVGTIDFRNLVSYWGVRSPSKDQGSSWTAIVLVDPRLTRIRRQHMSFELEDFQVPHKLFSEAIVWNDDSCSEQVPGLGTPAWSVLFPHRNHCNALFDEVTNYFQECGLPPHNDDPMSSTVYIRNFVRSAWEESIWRWDVDLHDGILESNSNIDDQRNRGLLTGENILKSYHELMRETASIKDHRQLVRRVMRAFRCSNTTYQKEQPDHPSSPTADVPSSELIAVERRSWEIILEKIDRTEQNLRDHMEMFSQRGAFLQALEAEKQTMEANRMARSSGQLTKIATVIVPCSFVASIFSMGNEFAAGQRLFFVYWVISMPVTFSLLAWVIYGNRLAAAWSKTKEQRRAGEVARSKWAMQRSFMSNLKSGAGQSAGQEKRCTEV